ncbi:MAG: carbohydrate-binding family 9-like protein [Candidatus Omnitrophica bacterium]|nr:carbohydrate-binding family 9-like protein [Candidatus Omnitrophota bacterium]
MVKKEVYDCLWTSQPVKIDGLLNEPAWENAKVLNFIEPVTNKKPLSKTDARLLWDDKYLYVGFKAYDKDIWSYYKKRDDPTCTEDVLEIFFKTDPQKEPYYNFEINALNTVYDAFNVRRNASGSDHRWSQWNCKGLKSAVKIKGTLNNWEDIDEWWCLEAAIPFSSISTLMGKIPKAGDKWLFHLARYDYSIYLPKGVELSSCTRLSKVNFHLYEDWMTLRFLRYD